MPRNLPSLSRLVRYWSIVGAAGLAAMALSWMPLAGQFDNYGIDSLFRLHKPAPWQPQSILLAIDDDSFNLIRGERGLRSALARALAVVATAKPRAVAIDVILADHHDATEDERLAAALHAARPVVLPAQLLDNRHWELPIPEFGAEASIGHVHEDADPLDGMSRVMLLEKRAGRERYWALALEAFRLARGGGPIEETPEDLGVGGVRIPAPAESGGQATGRPLRIRYLPPDDQGHSRIPRVSLAELLTDPAKAAAFRDKTVFVGATALSATRDRMMTPYTTLRPMPGVEIHAQTFETLAQGRFFRDASPSLAVFASIVLTILAGLVFLRWTGLTAYLLGAAILLAGHALPHLFFLNGIIFPYVLPILVVWFAVTAAAVQQYFATRADLATAGSARDRYRQAIQFVTHEMRTPLTAIQGSSELMGKYKLTEEKQKQLAGQIFNESRRMARMIQTFLDVERLSAGEMEMKTDRFPLAELLAGCVDRIRDLAERKCISISLHDPARVGIEGDRELMEYAVYNLLTNAVKYSPAETHVDVTSEKNGKEVRVAVKDQGIGMDEKEIANVFKKFYRTRKAEDSGEVGTGIGLSIVEQIVTHHGGRMEVTSSPGKGSCFTMVVPAFAPPASTPPEWEK